MRPHTEDELSRERWYGTVHKGDEPRLSWVGVDISRDSPIPLYYQLAEATKERISLGDVRPGERLPSERELAEQVGVSRMTARQAVQYLVREGILVAKKGNGTFVAKPKLTYDALHLLGFTEELMAQGQATVGSRVLEHARTVPPPRVATDLELAPGAEVIKTVRQRLSGGKALLLETSYLPARLCPGLEHEDLSDESLYALLEQRYGLRLQRAEQTLEATNAHEYESALLGVEPKTALLRLEGITYLEGGTPVEYFVAIYRGDRFKFRLENWREHRGDAQRGAPHVSVAITQGA